MKFNFNGIWVVGICLASSICFINALRSTFPIRFPCSNSHAVRQLRCMSNSPAENDDNDGNRPSKKRQMQWPLDSLEVPDYLDGALYKYANCVLFWHTIDILLTYMSIVVLWSNSLISFLKCDLTFPLGFIGSLAGDAGFDPLNFAQNSKRLFVLREAEMKHARLAMLAAVGWY